MKVTCLFCEAQIEGAEEYMLGGGRFDDKGGHPEKWLKFIPEHKWAWNGLTSRCADGKEKSARFHLCPDHQSEEDYKKAFDWAREHSNRVLPSGVEEK